MKYGKNGMTHRWVVLPLGMLAAALMWLLPGTSGAQQQGQQETNEITDQGITDAIEDELLFDHGVPSHKVDVTTAVGVVTLEGTVTNILAKERAARIAETVKGVSAVVNEIDVQPIVSPSDEELRSDIEAALLADPAAESYEVTVGADDGKVTLTGTVESWQEKQLAANVAKSVRGVKSLSNEISVDYETDRADSEIETEVEEALRWDVLVDDTLIDVEVSDGEVILSGTVGSLAEKTEAVANSWVAGVVSVDDTALEVERWARDEDLRRGKYVAKTDAEIQDAVETALVYDARVNSFNVDTSVDNGVVTLRGTVESLEAKKAAARTARNTVGVWRVKNRLKVETDAPLTDEEIRIEVEHAMIREPRVDFRDVDPVVVDGTVYLNGTADSFLEKMSAEDAAEGVEGVVEVVNNLSVVGDVVAITYDPYVDPWVVYDYKWYTYEPVYTPLDDWEIRDDIQDELFWSPFVDADEVTVTVNDGVATLTGTVDTWAERRAASENAIEGGAVSVDNDLDVAYGPPL